MAVYTLVITRPTGFQTKALTTFDTDNLAISDSGVFVSAENPAVAVARGSGDDLHFLGSWDFNDGKKAWTAES